MTNRVSSVSSLRQRRHASVAAIVFAASVLAAAPAWAVEPSPTPTAVPEQDSSLESMIRALRGFLTEDDVRLIGVYLLDSTIAAVRGGEAEPLPPDLVFKLQVLQRRIQKEGGQYLEGLAKKLRDDLAKDLRARVPVAPPAALPRSTPAPTPSVVPTPMPVLLYNPPPLVPWR